MATHVLQLTYEEFQKNHKSIADTIIDKYCVFEKLGTGAFGSVYRGLNDQTKKQVAIKVLDMVAIDREESNTKVKEIRRRLAKTQSELMKRVHSHHVMKLYDVYENKSLKIMVIEFCNGGTLSEEIINRNKIPEKQAIEILKQLILGIADMHKENIIHRDLKTQNIMSHNGVYKIVDLGFAKMIPSDSDVFGTVLGTIITMAPEVMRKEKYGLKADIWSLGVIFYEMIYGRLPYEPMKSVDMYEQILKKNIFPNQGKINNVQPSKQALDLLKRLLKINQNERISWKQLITLPIFKPQQSLSPTYRVTVNLDKLKQVEVHQRNELDVINNLVETENNGQMDNTKEKKIRLQILPSYQKDQKKKSKDNSEDTIVKWAKENHLECLKTQLIFKNIVLVIEERKMLNLKNRKCVELMYLLVFRCFVNMSFVLNDFIDCDNFIVNNLKKTVEILYDQVSNKFNFYCSQLKKQEDKVLSIIGDRLNKIFKSDSIRQKDTFLTGFQPMQFKKQEQISFTYQHYIKQLISQVKPKDINLLSILDRYVEINAISTTELVNKNFFERVEEIMKKSELFYG